MPVVSFPVLLIQFLPFVGQSKLHPGSKMAEASQFIISLEALHN